MCIVDTCSSACGGFWEGTGLVFKHVGSRNDSEDISYPDFVVQLGVNGLNVEYGPVSFLVAQCGLPPSGKLLRAASIALSPEVVDFCVWWWTGLGSLLCSFKLFYMELEV